jgi:hypothetical protein
MSGVVPVVGRDEGVVQVLAVVVEGRVSGAMVVVKAAEAGREVRATSADFNKDYLSCRFIRGATPPADYCEGVDCVSSEILSNKPRYRKKNSFAQSHNCDTQAPLRYATSLHGRLFI